MWLRHGKLPEEVAEDAFTLRLCEMYHCRPSELEEEDWHTMMRHRAIKAAEAEYLAADAKANRTFANLKRGRRGRK